MTDLEDKILKTNIPGKYTWWDKDSDEEHSLHDSDEELTDEQLKERGMTDMQKVQKWESMGDVPKPLQMAALNNARRAAGEVGAMHTGPKGVLNDYKNAKREAEANYEIEQQ